MPLKRPAAPRDDHSPSPLPLPPPNEDDVRRAREKREAVVETSSKPQTVVAHRRRREPVHRTRKEEMEAYGRTFAGCGQQGDYDMTTKLGEGTFGEVHKAVQTLTGRAVALKRILMHNEKEGMPVTALREIKILKAMNHPCIINILDMFVVRGNGDTPLSVYMVFPYMDHDLAGLLENERVKLQPSHIKLYMKQLLEGTAYMHRNHILHRDMKAANLLIDNSGSLRIADFGLARAFDPAIVHGALDQHGKEKKYTNCVVTRWYRPPELLLGARQYGGEVDIWGIGCVLGEMFMRRPILPGTSDIDQLEKIWQLCGTPNQHTWPNFDALPGCEGVKRFPNYSKKLKTAYDSIGPETCDLLDKLLTCNPRERITASQALDHDYFWTDPLPADPRTLPTYEASHEFDKRGRRNQPPPGAMAPDRFRPPHPPHPQPPFFGREPPPRGSFRQGAPPYGSRPPLPHQNLHPHYYHPYPRPPPHRGPPPLPPLPPPNLPERPSFLPPKPAAPLGPSAGQHEARHDRDKGTRPKYGGGGGGRPPNNGGGNTDVVGLPY
ncbi:kinase-like domain-containing protein [Phlebopus sp. FC_14]|nr:kinase-like domain-containing protein [Phlebopus sp. FC_14]